MYSPNKRPSSSSPIRGLDERSPSKSHALQTILEEELHYTRNNDLINDNFILLEQNKLLNDRISNYAHQNQRSFLENSSLRRQNQLLKQREFMNMSEVAGVMENKEVELQTMQSEIQLIKNYYERQIELMKVEKQSLRKQINSLHAANHQQSVLMRQKYSKMTAEDINMTKRNYIEDLRRTCDALQSNKRLLLEKQIELEQISMIHKQISHEHSKNLECLIVENNILRNKLKIELERANLEIKEVEHKKELEKSRTHGILNHTKETHSFMEKEIMRLSEELNAKNGILDSNNKQILKLQKELQTAHKKHEQAINKILETHTLEKNDLQTSLHKMQNVFNSQIAECHTKQVSLQQQLTSKTDNMNNLIRQLQHQRTQSIDKDNQINALKNSIDQLHKDHAKQINQVMSERKSMKSLSDIPRTFKNIPRADSILNHEALKAVAEQQEAVGYELGAGEPYEEQQQIKSLIAHYENVMSETEKTHQIYRARTQDRIEQLNQSLEAKKQQVLEILQRFSPLMQYKLNAVSIESQRKQKIEQHYKANIDILDVMLNKYEVVALKSKENKY